MKSKTMKNMKIIIIVIVLIVVAALCFIYFKSKGGDSAEGAAMNGTTTLPAGAAQYSNSDLGFSFQYPAEAAIQEPPTDGGFMVTVNDAKTNESLQIFVTPFSDVPSVITADYIKEQVPDLAVENPMPISGLSSGGAGASFSSSVNGQPVLEYWFAAGTGAAEYLYQMTATAGSADLAGEILKSFRTINNASQ